MGAVTFGTPGVLGRAQRRAVALAETFPLALAAETAAAAVISGVGGLAMMLPIDGAKRSNGSVLQMDLLIYNMPLALTAGALICVIAVSITAAIDSSRLAWSAVFAAAVAMLLNHVVLVRLETRSLSTLNYVDCALAGVILGCVAVAVWPRPVAVAGYLFGALSSILVADLAQPSDFGTTLPGLDFWRGSPPLWLILAALALMLISGLVYRPPQRTHSTDDSAVVPMKPVLSAVVIYTGVLGSSMLMAHHTTIGSIVIGAVVLFAATAVAALMLPGRDGLLVVAMVAFAPAGSAVFTVPRPGWSTGLVVAGVVIGLYLGRRLRNPYLALAGSLLLAVSAIATASLTDTPGAAVTVPGCLGLALVCGYTFGCAIGPRATSAVVGLGIAFVPSAGVALQGRAVGRVEYSQTWYRSVDAAAQGPLAGIVSAAIVVGCAVIAVMIGLLRPRRALAVRSDSDR